MQQKALLAFLEEDLWMSPQSAVQILLSWRKCSWKFSLGTLLVTCRALVAWAATRGLLPVGEVVAIRELSTFPDCHKLVRVGTEQ